MTKSLWSALVFGVVLGVLTTGCNKDKDTKDYPKDADKNAKKEEGHDHDHEGPHDGVIIELGGEDYHAELVHDDENSLVTVYILDSSAKKAMPIAAKDVEIRLSHDGEPEQFKLAAKPEEGESDGMSSRFESNDDHLLIHMDEEGTKQELVVEIKGKQYRGEIPEHKHED